MMTDQESPSIMLAHLDSEASSSQDHQLAMTTSLAADYGIPHRNRHSFVNYHQFRRLLGDSYEGLVAGTQSSFLSMTNIKPAIIKWMDRKYRELPPVRIEYNESTETLIVKLVGPGHETASRLFYHIFSIQCGTAGITLRDLKPTGAGRFNFVGSEKEGDESLRPTNTRPAEDDRPTIVVEVGVSQSFNPLRVAAHHWLTKTHGEVHIVILIHVKLNDRVLEIERWELRPASRPRGLNVDRPAKIQSLTLSIDPNGQTVVRGAPLIIPIDKLFDVIPAHVQGTHVSLGPQELTTLVTACFA